MSLTVLALLAAPAPPQLCDLRPRVFVDGVVTTVTQAPAAPFDQIAVGDTLGITLAFGADVLCTAFPGLGGHIAAADCSELNVGGASALLDSASGTCVWGERFVPGSPSFFDLVTADAAFGDGQIRAVLDMTDPQGLVGISISELIQNTISVPSVTASGFSVSLSLVDDTGALLATVDVLELSGQGGSPELFGFNYCTAVPNSTGSPAAMRGFASLLAANNNVNLVAVDLPLHSFGYFLVSSQQGFLGGPPNSVGNLCLRGSIGRFVGPGQIQNSGSDGIVRMNVDLTLLPTPTGFVSVQAGETWNFTYWYRDFTTVVTSNFADGVSLPFN